MYANKSQRTDLNALSKKIWGAESKWNKIKGHQSFKIPVATREVPDRRNDCVTINRTVMKRSTALNKGLVSDIEEFPMVTETVFREASADELYYMMERIFDEIRISVIDTTNLTIAKIDMYAFKVIDGFDYPWNKFLLKQEGSGEYGADLEKALSVLDEDVQKELKEHLVSTEETDKVTKSNNHSSYFDAIEFAEACKNAFDYYSDSKMAFDATIEKVDTILASKK